jgi:hypothetical protein
MACLLIDSLRMKFYSSAIPEGHMVRRISLIWGILGISKEEE